MVIQKSPDTKKEVLPEETKTKGKRKHRETVCSDKRRDSEHCGICGSDDLVFEQLVYCTKCDAEIFNIGVKTSWRIGKELYPCACKGDFLHAYRGREFYKIVHGDFTNRVCLSCNSIETNSCPVCDKSRKNSYYDGKCWTSTTGEKFCRYCGYRHPGYGKVKI